MTPGGAGEKMNLLFILLSFLGWCASSYSIANDVPPALERGDFQVFESNLLTFGFLPQMDNPTLVALSQSNRYFRQLTLQQRNQRLENLVQQYQNNFNENAPCVAAQEGKYQLFLNLLPSQANLSRRYVDGKTLLYCAVEGQNIQIVDHLLNLGAPIYLGGESLMPLIHVAVLKKNIQMVAHLIELGYPINEKNQYGQTALYLAELYQHWDIVAYMKARGGEAIPEIVYGCFGH